MFILGGHFSIALFMEELEYFEICEFKGYLKVVGVCLKQLEEFKDVRLGGTLYLIYLLEDG